MSSDLHILFVIYFCCSAERCSAAVSNKLQKTFIYCIIFFFLTHPLNFGCQHVSGESELRSKQMPFSLKSLHLDRFEQVHAVI